MSRAGRTFSANKSRARTKGESSRNNNGGWQPNEEVIERVSEMMGRRWPKGMMTDWICEYAGKQLGVKDRKRYYYLPSRETLEKVFTLAREDIVARQNIDKPYEKSVAKIFYESIIRDPLATNTEKIRAQERLDNLLGTDAKFVDPKGGHQDAAAKRIRQALADIDAATTGLLEGQS